MVSDAEKTGGLSSVIESGDDETEDERADCVEIYTGTRGGVGG